MAQTQLNLCDFTLIYFVCFYSIFISTSVLGCKRLTFLPKVGVGYSSSDGDRELYSDTAVWAGQPQHVQIQWEQQPGQQETAGPRQPRRQQTPPQPEAGRKSEWRNFCFKSKYSQTFEGK